jgi:hypothetical protein
MFKNTGRGGKRKVFLRGRGKLLLHIEHEEGGGGKNLGIIHSTYYTHYSVLF